MRLFSTLSARLLNSLARTGGTGQRIFDDAILTLSKQSAPIPLLPSTNSAQRSFSSISNGWPLRPTQTQRESLSSATCLFMLVVTQPMSGRTKSFSCLAQIASLLQLRACHLTHSPRMASFGAIHFMTGLRMRVRVTDGGLDVLVAPSSYMTRCESITSVLSRRTTLFLLMLQPQRPANGWSVLVRAFQGNREGARGGANCC